MSKAEYTTVRLDIPSPFPMPKGKANELVGHALHRLRMAVAEVRVITKKKEAGPEIIANAETLKRAQLTWTQAAQAIGMARQAAGLTEGAQRPNSATIEKAANKLEEYRRILAKLEVMEVQDD